jgi:hypothetical protein
VGQKEPDRTLAYGCSRATASSFFAGVVEVGQASVSELGRERSEALVQPQACFRRSLSGLSQIPKPSRAPTAFPRLPNYLSARKSEPTAAVS